MLRVPTILLSANGGGIEVGMKVQRVNEIAVRRARLRSNEKRLTKLAQRVIEAAFFLENVSELMMRLEKIRPDAERAAVETFGCIGLSVLGGAVAEIDQRIGVIRIDFDRALENSGGFGAAIEGAQRHAEDVVRGRVIGLERNRALTAGDGEPELAL